MELKAIERMLGRYLEGETSIEEERKLRQYFCSENVEVDLQNYIPLFRYFDLAKEERLEKRVRYKKEKKEVYSWVAIAASVVIAAGIFLNRPVENQRLGSFQDPELALEKTRETLDMVSRLMNNGREDLLYIKEFNYAKNSFLK